MVYTASNQYKVNGLLACAQRTGSPVNWTAISTLTPTLTSTPFLASIFALNALGSSREAGAINNRFNHFFSNYLTKPIRMETQ